MMEQGKMEAITMVRYWLKDALEEADNAMNLPKRREEMRDEAVVLQAEINAMEKQEPMKPEKIEPCNNGLRFGWCPKCECSQVCETANYCKTCGQALNWEEDAE